MPLSSMQVPHSNPVHLSLRTNTQCRGFPSLAQQATPVVHVDTLGDLVPTLAAPKRLGRQDWKLLSSGSHKGATTAPASIDHHSLREKLQHALTALNDHPFDRKLQQAAHRAHFAFSRQPAPPPSSSWGPIVHQALKVGLAGSLPTFGIGRELGVQLGSRTTALGPTPGFKDIRRGVFQLGFGAVGGAVGHLAGKALLEPVIDKLPRQFRPVPAAALLPDDMVEAMNQIRGGWGDEARAHIVAQQVKIEQLHSEPNIRFMEMAYGATTAARMLLQVRFKPSLLRSLAGAGAASGLAGAALGANVARKMASAEVAIPRQETLDWILANKPQGRPEKIAMANAQHMPLFFTHHAPISRRRGHSPVLLHPRPMCNNSNPLPQQQVAHTGVHLSDHRTQNHPLSTDMKYTGMLAASRFEYMMRATAVPSMLYAARPLIAGAMPNALAAKMSDVLTTVIANQLIVRPWYEAVSGPISERDAAINAHRQSSPKP